MIREKCAGKGAACALRTRMGFGLVGFNPLSRTNDVLVEERVERPQLRRGWP